VPDDATAVPAKGDVMVYASSQNPPEELERVLVRALDSKPTVIIDGPG
jgi:hypothetical protein